MVAILVLIGLYSLNKNNNIILNPNNCYELSVKDFDGTLKSYKYKVLEKTDANYEVFSFSSGTSYPIHLNQDLSRLKLSADCSTNQLKNKLEESIDPVTNQKLVQVDPILSFSSPELLYKRAMRIK